MLFLLFDREECNRRGETDHFILESDGVQDVGDFNSVHARASTQNGTRRNVLSKIATATAAVTSSSSSALLPSSFWFQQVQPSFGEDLDTFISRSNSSGRIPKINCLLNLPPVAKDHARVFLCRHGQTENNRLRLVQGARVDPPINNIGRMQAIRLGEALLAVKQNKELGVPTVALHSSLKRARETAAVASWVIGNTNNNGREEDYLAYVNEIFARDDTGIEANLANNLRPNELLLENLPYLGEVDFGAMEGKSVNEAKTEMMATFAQWAVGKIDVKNGDDGESARSVLTRASLALESMLDVASSSTTGGSVMAVSHSTFLRTLLALVMDVPLLQAAMFEQKNCCINVLDISLNDKVEVSPTSNIFGGRLSMAPKDFNLIIPKVQVVRMNEIDHLDGLLL